MENINSYKKIKSLFIVFLLSFIIIIVSLIYNYERKIDYTKNNIEIKTLSLSDINIMIDKNNYLYIMLIDKDNKSTYGNNYYKQIICLNDTVSYTLFLMIENEINKKYYENIK